MAEINLEQAYMTARKRKLRHYHQRFVEEYAIDRNPIQAYYRAYGYVQANGERFRPQFVEKEVKKILDNPNIQNAIKLYGEWCKRDPATVDEVLCRYEDIAMHDPIDLFHVDYLTTQDPITRQVVVDKVARYKTLDEMSVRTRMAIHSIKTDGSGRIVDVKLIKRSEGLAALAKHLGMRAGKEIYDFDSTDEKAMQMYQATIERMKANYAMSNDSTNGVNGNGKH